ncbi:hypothetical protein F0U59_51715 [Archangium gephyra]|nr:hypothetical protein F0U59_51715 [Archangium gephyra]
MQIWRFVAVVAGVLAAGCAHFTDSTADTSSSRRLERLPYHAPEADARAGCSSVGARINVLIAKGQFAEAEASLFEVKQMLENKNFSLATEAQLKMVKKLLKDPERVMEKMGTVR